MTNGDKSEKEISREFYEIFHQTRLMLIRAFQEKKDVGEQEALYYAQRFMERAIFLFFALDKGLINNQKLFSDTIFERLKKQECTDESKDIWNDISHLFKALDQGDLQLDIHGFGGDLFSPPLPKKIYFLDFQTKVFFANEIMISKIRKEPKLDGENLETWNKFGDSVSPIIKNLLIMDSYDFKSTLNVAILGHILEQSLDDLNEFQKTGEIKRKIDGVFYTPVTLTNYICRNTIIPYLSKNNANTVPELISEYQDDLEELEKKTSQIKVIDPACGSGAFLINAAQILIEISESIQMKKGKPQASSGTLDTWQKEIETSKIIQNNIFGVDINRDSVEITKLSLFLIMAKPGEKLTNLSQNIIHGNSLISDKDIDPIGFDWRDKFSETMDKGGFDIVIGNPPWQGVKSDIDEFFTPLKEMKLLLNVEFPNQKVPFSKLKKSIKTYLIKKCLANTKINSEWKNYLFKYKKQMTYFNDTKFFKFQISTVKGKKSTGIDINLYKLFSEKTFQILKNKGIAGLILPSGIYSDLGTKSLRELFFEKCSIQELCGFVNVKKIFRDVDSRVKFCTLLLRKEGSTKKFLAKFRVIDELDLLDFQNTAFDYDLGLVKMSSPDSLSIIECSGKTDKQILQKMYKHTLLQSEKWNFKVSREFHMTDDSHLFQIENIGIPLFKGEMMNQFTNTFAPPIYWIDKKEGTTELIRKEKYRIKRSLKQKDLKIIPKIDSQEYRLVWRVQTNFSNQRTLISTILPPNVFLGNSLNYLNPLIFDGVKYSRRISFNETMFLCGMFNSFVVDYILRHKIATNLNAYLIKQSPIPKFDNSNMLHKKIFKNSSMLICTTDEYAKLREEVGISEYVTEPEKRMVLEAQINAAAAKIYDLTKDEFEYVLKSFPSADKDLKDMAMREFLLP